ncbi:MAG: 4Fe-4S binding protein [Planctomycetota bacterium]|jgi:pyruvate ferredoxin oxidoreductase delta subunit
MIKLPVVLVGKEVEAAETGSWRALKPIIDKEKCTNCGICASLCPDGVILETSGTFEIDYVFCKGCGICANECAAKAIKIIREGE